MTVFPGNIEPHVHQDWRRILALFVFVFAVILVLYRETAMSMVEVWARSETYAHGFLVPPIALWLVWMARHRVAGLMPQPKRLAVLVAIGLGLVWLTGEMAKVAPLSQFALVAMIVSIVPMLCGWRVTRELAFPLGFLFFSVPFGDFAMSQLMDWTANATVFGLRLSGVPVYREGLQFVIPSGNWSVVEACSGIRYLIASVVVGALYAYLTYSSLKRRLIFVVVSFLVPIFANWMRAYLIVMLGHWSGNRLAAGADHLIYGWLFFGVVIFLLFWIGSRWREVRDEQDLPPVNAVPVTATPASQQVRVAALAVAACALWPAAQWQLDRQQPFGSVAFPAAIEAPGWTILTDKLVVWKPRFENPSAEYQSVYATGNRRVGVYLAYYRNQNAKRKLVSSTNVLVTSSDRDWSRVGGGWKKIPLDGKGIDIRTSELARADGSRLQAWQWYWINGRLTASDSVAKVYTGLSRLLGQGDDSAVIILYVYKDSEENILENFAKVAMPVIAKQLEQLRELP